MSSAAEFRRRAFFEARRYGGGSWVFVRELLQNSRDAGATRVEFEVERRDGVDRLICRDDGCGMTFDHARRYLFTLYASSKGGESDTAGRFGIGFWSVLRFGPDQVIIRSAPSSGRAWELRLSGDLETVERGPSSVSQGTEIVLVRAASGGDPASEVWAAVRRDARYLRRRDPNDEILDVRVSGRRATEEINLEAPSLEISRGALRGAVALADRPAVDLLAHGLRVRTTATLDELLTQPDDRRRRPPSPDQLVPRVILDSRHLQVLMARGDARTDRELRRLVAMGRRGVERLVRGQLDREAGLGPVASAAMRAVEIASSRWTRRVVAGLAAMALVAAGMWWWFDGRLSPPGMAPAAGVEAAELSIAPPESILDARRSDGYRGPAVAPLGPQVAALDLRYRPVDAEPMLVVFRVKDLDDDGRVVVRDTDVAMQSYRGLLCLDQCLHVELDLGGASDRVRLPVPTGHLVDPTSLRMDGEAIQLLAGSDGLPVIEVNGRGNHRVEYRTGPGVERSGSTNGRWPALPETLESFAVRLGPFRPEEAARAATTWVEERVAYDTSVDTMDRHRKAAGQGLGFVDRCLTVGAGDCDVQNALLAAILHGAGLQVRMAVGYVGLGGRALPGLHAWVEYRGGDGAWRWVDASRNAPAGLRAAPAQPRERVAGRGSLVGVADDSGQENRSSPDPWVRPIVVGLFIGVAAVGVIMVRRSKSTISDLSLSDAPDVAGLCRGALARPDSYRNIPALFRRRIVPMIGDRPINLDRARRLADRGRLAVGTGSSSLIRGAVDRRRNVIDGGREDGRAVAEVLGAIDLDWWGRVIERGLDHPVLLRLANEAETGGLVWKLVLTPIAGGETHVLDGPFAGTGNEQAFVAIDPTGELWKQVCELFDPTPATATLLLADHVIEAMSTAGTRSMRLLARLASAALAERAGDSS